MGTQLGDSAGSPELLLPATHTDTHTSRGASKSRARCGDAVRYCTQTLYTFVAASSCALPLWHYVARRGQLRAEVKRHVFVFFFSFFLIFFFFFFLEVGKKSRSKLRLHVWTGDCLRGPVYAYLIEVWAARIQSTSHQVGLQVEQGDERGREKRARIFYLFFFFKCLWQIWPAERTLHAKLFQLVLFWLCLSCQIRDWDSRRERTVDIILE